MQFPLFFRRTTVAFALACAPLTAPAATAPTAPSASSGTTSSTLPPARVKTTLDNYKRALDKVADAYELSDERAAKQLDGVWDVRE